MTNVIKQRGGGGVHLIKTLRMSLDSKNYSRIVMPAIVLTISYNHNNNSSNNNYNNINNNITTTVIITTQ